MNTSPEGGQPSLNPEELDVMAERTFHAERFKAQSKKHAARGRVKKIFDKHADLAPVDFAHLEAIHDDAEFERQRSAEYQEWRKAVAAVIENLRQRKNDPEHEGRDIKPVLLILGGGMRGAYGAGQVAALRKMGYANTFDAVVGISAGAPDGAYFLAGDEQVLLGSSIYYQECTTPEFLNFSRINKIMDLDYLTEVFRSGPKALNTEAIKAARPEFYVQAVDTATRQAELINAKTANTGMLNAIRASMALPIAYGRAVDVNGRQYIDGAFEPLPVKRVIDQLHPTDILVLPNLPFADADSYQPALGDTALAQVMPRKGLFSFEHDVLHHKQELRRSLEMIREKTGINIGILWPPDSGLRTISTDGQDVKAAVIAAMKDTYKNFGEPHPVELI